MARVEPLNVSSWPAEMRDAMAAMTPPDARFSVQPKDEGRQKPMNMLGVFAHHPSLARAFFTFNGHALMATTLTERQRELLALRTAALLACEYEWAQHVHMARDAGLTDVEISGIAMGPGAPCWSGLESSMLRAADELVADGVIGDETWKALSSQLDTKQVLDLIFTVGAYGTLAWMMRSVELRLDPGYSRGGIGSV